MSNTEKNMIIVCDNNVPKNVAKICRNRYLNKRVIEKNMIMFLYFLQVKQNNSSY